VAPSARGRDFRVTAGRSLPRIGLICPIWLPRFGGGEQYAYRMARLLRSRGFDVHVFSGTAASDGVRDNGDDIAAVSRWIAASTISGTSAPIGRSAQAPS